MQKNQGFVLVKLLPLLLILGAILITGYLLTIKTGLLNFASNPEEPDYAISFSNNTATGSANFVSYSPQATSAGSLVLKMPFTIEGWFKTPKPTSGNYSHVYTPLAMHAWPSIINNNYLYKLSFETQDSDGSTRPMFYVLHTNPQPYDHNNYISVGGGSSTAMPANTWNHIAVTATSSGNLCFANMFINGHLVESQSQYSPNCQTWTDSPTEFTLAKPIAGEGGISGYYYPGMLNNIRISKTQRYFSDFVPQTTAFTSDTNTIALWNFDQNVLDQTSNMNNGVIKGSVSYVPLTTASPSATPTPTSVPQVTLQVSTTSATTTLTKNYDSTSGLTMNPGFIITNPGPATGWQLKSNQDATFTAVGGTPVPVLVQGFGFYDSSGGIQSQGSYTVRAYVNNNRPAGLYKGSYNLEQILTGGNKVVAKINYVLTVKESNILKNNSFETDTNTDGVPDNWLSEKLFNDSLTTTESFDGTKSFMFSPRPTTQTDRELISETIPFNGQPGDKLVLSVFDKLVGSASASPGQTSGATVQVFYIDGTKSPVSFLPFKTTAHGWQQSETPLTVTKIYNQIYVVLFNRSPIGTYYLDNISLIINRAP